MIETRCYPWKAPKTSRNGGVALRQQSGSYRKWKSWTTDIQMVLLPLYRHHWGMAIFHGPVDLDLLFVADPDHPWADRTNLGKAFEDLLQGIVIENDRQVRGGDIRRVLIGEPVYGKRGELWEGPERVHFRVTCLS